MNRCLIVYSAVKIDDVEEPENEMEEIERLVLLNHFQFTLSLQKATEKRVFFTSALCHMDIIAFITAGIISSCV